MRGKEIIKIKAQINEIETHRKIDRMSQGVSEQKCLEKNREDTKE